MYLAPTIHPKGAVVWHRGTQTTSPLRAIFEQNSIRPGKSSGIQRGYHQNAPSAVVVMMVVVVQPVAFIFGSYGAT